MPSLRRWVVAGAAALAGTAVAVTLLLYGGAEPPGDQYLVLASDLPAGTVLASGSLRYERLRLGVAARSAYPSASERTVLGRRTGHDLLAGQLLQRADLLPEAGARDRDLDLLDRLALDRERVEQRRAGDDRGAVLIVVEHRDREPLAQLLLDTAHAVGDHFQVSEQQFFAETAQLARQVALAIAVENDEKPSRFAENRPVPEPQLV